MVSIAGTAVGFVVATYFFLIAGSPPYGRVSV
jgi:hypothetical protein